MFFNNNNNCCCQNNNWQQEGSCCEMDRQCGCGCGPIVEQPICPIHTRVINNHIIEHTYRPEYSCSEENTVTNIDPGCSGNNF